MLHFLLIDDHQIVREGLRAMLERNPEWVVVGEAEDGIDGLRLALSLQPQVVLADMMMPGANGLEVCRRLRASGFTGAVMILSAHAGEELTAAAREAGVTCVLPKSAGFAQLTATIAEMLAGHLVAQPVTAAGTASFGLDRLTPREQEVLQHIASGTPPKQIAQELGISPKTLDVHRARLMRKLKASGPAELTRIAVRAGLASL